MQQNKRPFFSVIHPNTFLVNINNPSTVRRGVEGKASDNLSIQVTYYAWAYHRISVLFPLFFFFFFLVFFIYCSGEGGGRVVRWCWVNFQCRGVLLTWIIVRLTALTVGAGEGCLDIFSLVSFLLFLPLSGRRSDIDWNTVSKQPANQLRGRDSYFFIINSEFNAHLKQIFFSLVTNTICHCCEPMLFRQFRA